MPSGVYIRKTIHQYFWSKVNKTDTCWNWTSALTHGYGSIGYKGKTYLAHRLVWYLTYGKFSGQCILHRCDNKKCVNPDHLFEGTRKDNTQDMIKKGRSRFSHMGEEHGKHKLATWEVRKIRKIFESNPIWGMQTSLAKQFDVSSALIHNIITRNRWKHI